MILNKNRIDVVPFLLEKNALGNITYENIDFKFTIRCASKECNYAENLGKHLSLWRNVNLSDITWSLIDYNSGRV